MGNKLAILLFILPALAIFITFDFIPIIQVFAYSFTDWNGLTIPNFTGLKNYIDLFTDRVFFTSNRNQIIFAIVITVYQMLFATIFAITISDKKMKVRYRKVDEEGNPISGIEIKLYNFTRKTANYSDYLYICAITDDDGYLTRPCSGKNKTSDSP